MRRRNVVAGLGTVAGAYPWLAWAQHAGRGRIVRRALLGEGSLQRLDLRRQRVAVGLDLALGRGRSDPPASATSHCRARAGATLEPAVVTRACSARSSKGAGCSRVAAPARLFNINTLFVNQIASKKSGLRPATMTLDMGLYRQSKTTNPHMLNITPCCMACGLSFCALNCPGKAVLN